MNEPELNPIRINALLAALQQQRDAALNHLVQVSADLACARAELQQLQQAKEPDETAPLRMVDRKEKAVP